MNKSILKQIIREELKNILNESTKVSSLKQGNTFTLDTDLGEFKEGETVKVESTRPHGGDNTILVLVSTSGKEKKGTFQFDNNDPID